MITPLQRDRQFLKTLWQNRLFECSGLSLCTGERFEVVSTGSVNTDRDDLPDFSFASLYFPDTEVTLHGSIKIDTLSSHWRSQGTINAPEFSAVILHVVFEQDMILSSGDRDIPTLVLRPSAAIADLVDNLRRGGDTCPRILGAMDPMHSNHLLTRVMSDRLDRKSQEVLDIYESVGQSWHETAYICFMRAFGYREKKASFELLARSLPLRYLRLHSDSLMQLEALILGQAGYLDVPMPDQYTRQMIDEYRALSQRHHLRPKHISWRGTAVRPGSLPVQSLVRIAKILHVEESFLDRILDARNCDELFVIFDVLLDEYWHTHFAPSRPATINSHGITKEKNELIIINFVIPLLTAYGITTANEMIRDRAIDLYEALPAENNSPYV